MLDDSQVIFSIVCRVVGEFLDTEMPNTSHTTGAIFNNKHLLRHLHIEAMSMKIYDIEKHHDIGGWMIKNHAIALHIPPVKF